MPFSCLFLVFGDELPIYHNHGGLLITPPSLALPTNHAIAREGAVACGSPKAGRRRR